MTDAELRERAHALANTSGTCMDLDYRRVFRHSDGCNAIFDELRAREAEIAQLRQRVADLERGWAAVRTLRTLDEYHEDYGSVLWWRVPVEEPPLYIGSPLDTDWPEDRDFTHWTKILEPLDAAPPPVQPSAPPEPETFAQLGAQVFNRMPPKEPHK